MLILHIVVALLGLVGAFISLFMPSKRLFIGNYALIATTIISGTYLVIETNSNILHACMSGLIYLSVTNALLLVAVMRKQQYFGS